MKHFLLFTGLIFGLFASAQVDLNVTVYLLDEAGNGAQGIPITISVQAAGAVYGEEVLTDESGMAASTIELPDGTMQGLVFISYLDCDSTEVTLQSGFSPNAFGGLNEVVVTGIYCAGGSGSECDMTIEGGLTMFGGWNFMVFDAPEGSVFEWMIDGVAMGGMNDSSFEWMFEGEGVWSVCVVVISNVCEPWTGCFEVDTTDPTGGGDCELSFEVVQSTDAAGNLIPNSVDVIIPELAGQPQYYWDFGDESTSEDATPTHEYATAGPYLLCLTAVWGDSTLCTATYCDTLSVDEDGMINFASGFVIHVIIGGESVGVELPETNAAGLIYPNPMQNSQSLNWSFSEAVELIRVYNLAGTLLNQMRLEPAASGSWSLPNLKSGVYLIEFRTEKGKNVQRLRVE